MSQALLLSDPVPSVSLHDGRPATTSLEVAKFFGKRHDHVMRGIKDIIDNCAELLSAPNFGAANSPESFSAHNFGLLPRRTSQEPPHVHHLPRRIHVAGHGLYGQEGPRDQAGVH